MSESLFSPQECSGLLQESSPGQLSPVAGEVVRGLSASPKTLSPWLFYDAAGSALFEEITRQPEYYLTAAERSIFEARADEIIALARGGETISVLELGAGTAAKTGVLLAAAVRAQSMVVYQPVDVSPAALAEAVATLGEQLPGVEVMPAVANYTNGLEMLDRPPGRRLALYIGSSIGNFEPSDAREVLRGLRAVLEPGDSFLLGVDIRKDPGVLLAAYDDAAGVTARFNRNVLVRIQRELDAELDPECFRHEARWNAAQSRIEMHLVSQGRQTITVPALGFEVHLADGESIHTENSYKYSPDSLRGLLSGAGFDIRQHWRDRAGRFAVVLARPV